jgi:hypothetical protein
MPGGPRGGGGIPCCMPCCCPCCCCCMPGGGGLMPCGGGPLPHGGGPPPQGMRPPHAHRRWRTPGCTTLEPMRRGRHVRTWRAGSELRRRWHALLLHHLGALISPLRQRTLASLHLLRTTLMLLLLHLHWRAPVTLRWWWQPLHHLPLLWRRRHRRRTAVERRWRMHGPVHVHHHAAIALGRRWRKSLSQLRGPDQLWRPTCEQSVRPILCCVRIVRCQHALCQTQSPPHHKAIVTHMLQKLQQYKQLTITHSPMPHKPIPSPALKTNKFENWNQTRTSLSPMPLAFRIFLVSIRHSDSSIAQILPIHGLHHFIHNRFNASVLIV